MTLTDIMLRKKQVTHKRIQRIHTVLFQLQEINEVSSQVSDSLPRHGLQHTRPPCPSPTPGAYSNSCPLSWWCHPTISSSVIPFSSYLQSFPASGSFQMSQLFTSDSQSIDEEVKLIYRAQVGGTFRGVVSGLKELSGMLDIFIFLLYINM